MSTGSASVSGGARWRPWRIISMRSEGSSAWLLAPAALLLAVCFVAPILVVFRWSFFADGPTLEFYREILGSTLYRTILARTLVFSLVAAVLSVVIGYPAAYFLATRPVHTRMNWLAVVLLPLWVSSLIRTYSWLILLGREGPANMALMALGLTDQPIQFLYGRGIVYAAMVQVLLPMAVTIMYAGMLSIEQTFIKAARILGASPAYAFRKVFLPLSASGITNALVICFVLSLGFFITPNLLGGPREAMISNMIDRAVNESLEWNLAAALGVVLLLVGIAVAGILAFAIRLLTSPGRMPR